MMYLLYNVFLKYYRKSLQNNMSLKMFVCSSSSAPRHLSCRGSRHQPRQHADVLLAARELRLRAAPQGHRGGLPSGQRRGARRGHRQSQVRAGGRLLRPRVGPR